MSNYAFYRQCLSYLTPRELRDYYLVMVLGVLAAMGELFGLASIIPVISVLTGSGVPNYFEPIVSYIPGLSVINFVSFFCLTVLIGSLFVSLIYSFARNRFSMRVGARLSTNVLSNYLSHSPKDFFARSESEFSRNISEIGGRISTGVLQNSLHMISRIVLILLSVGWLLIVNPQLTLMIFGIMLFSYGVIHKFIKGYIERVTRKTFSDSKKLLKLKLDAYKSYRLSVILNASNYIVEKSDFYRRRSARLNANVAIVGEAPKKVLETIGLVALLMCATFMSKTWASEILIPNMAVFALAAYRILPALQQLFHGFNKIIAVRSLSTTIKKALNPLAVEMKVNGDRPEKRFKKIELSKLCFGYSESGGYLINDLNQVLELKGFFLLQAPSGMGKSTLFDLLMGFLTPTKGAVFLDGESLYDQIDLWRNCISYVPQDYVVFGETFGEVIRFGEVNYDPQQLSLAMSVSGFDLVMNKLQLGLDSLVENSELSGGENSRLMIARALYRKSQVTFMDEPFSKLDVQSAKNIISGMKKYFSDRCFIMISHRTEEISEVSWKKIDLTS